MAEIKLSTYILMGVLALFLIMGLMNFVIDASEEFNTELDPYITSTLSNYSDRINVEQAKAFNLQNQTLSLDPDADSNDIEGSFIVKGWRTVRNTIGSTTQLVKTSYDIFQGTLQRLKLDGWMLGIGLLLLTLYLLIIGLRIAVERRGV